MVTVVAEKQSDYVAVRKTEEGTIIMTGEFRQVAFHASKDGFVVHDSLGDLAFVDTDKQALDVAYERLGMGAVPAFKRTYG